jgi:hypothetical protein
MLDMHFHTAPRLSVFRTTADDLSKASQSGTKNYTRRRFVRELV